MPVPKLLSVAQVSAKLQCARSTVRKLVAHGELRASRIRSRTIRIYETDLQTYLDGRANFSPVRNGFLAAKGSHPMTTDLLTAILAEKVMGWRVAPERFLMQGRRWMPRWRFQPAVRIEDARRLLEAAGPEDFAMEAGNGGYQAKVRIAGVTGEAHEASQARAMTFAIARAIGLDVSACE